MRLTDAFLISYKGVIANKMRAFLTTLGIVIGIASVIMMLSLGAGAEGLILGQIASLGPDAVMVGPGGTTKSGVPNFAGLVALKYRDYPELRKIPSLKAVAPVLYLDAQINYGAEHVSPTIFGTSSDIVEIYGLELASGAFFTRDDYDSARSVVVIASKVADSLFGLTEPVGKQVFIKRKAFTVVGVLEPQGTKFFQDFDDRAYIPLSAARNQISGVDYVTMFATVASGSTDRAQEDLKYTLRTLHHIDNPKDDPSLDDFHLETAKEAADMLSTITGVFTLFLAAIASISLVVGGIGIMNIMLVSVTERTREIGLRKAVGAGRGDIQLQFLIESLLLTLFGGSIGVAFGAFASWVISLVINYLQQGWVFEIPLSAVGLSFGVAAVVGLIFGIYPARQAAKLDPIEALRYE